MASDSLGLGWGLRFCVPNKLPEEEDAAGLETILSIRALLHDVETGVDGFWSMG